MTSRGPRRIASALLWGGVGFMTVLVLVQGSALLGEPLLALSRAAALGAVVGAATAATTYAIEHRVAARAARRAEN